MAKPETQHLDNLEKKIQEDPSKVTAQDVNQTYARLEEPLRAQYEQETDKAVKAVLDQQLKKLQEMREKQLEELEKMKAAKTPGRSKVVAETRLLMAETLDYIQNRDKRHAARSLDYTSAEKKAEQIEDYEGVDALHNKTRDMLTGYLAAYEGYDPVKAGQELQKAKEIYDKSNPGMLDFDKVLKYDQMIGGLNMEKYAALLDRYDLTPDGKGLIVGFLSIADKNFKDAKDKETYKDYVLGVLNALQTSNSLSPESWLEKNKREEQRQVLEVIKSPKEWLASKSIEADMNALALFNGLLTTVRDMQTVLGYQVKDAKILALIKKAPAEIKAADRAEIETAITKVNTEAVALFGAKVKESSDELARQKQKLENIIQRNKTEKKIQEAGFEQARKQFAAAEKNLTELAGTGAGALAGGVLLLTYTKEILAKSSTLLERFDQAFTMVIATTPPPTTVTPDAPPARKTPADVVPETKTPEKEEPAQSLAGFDKATDVVSRFKGFVQVMPTLNFIAAYDKNGLKTAEIKPGNILPVVDNKAKRLPDLTTYVKVIYEGKEIWLNESQLMTADVPAKDVAKEVDKENVKLADKIVDTSMDRDVKRILGVDYPIPDYYQGLNAAAAMIRNPEKYPDGVSFNVPFNYRDSACTLKFENGSEGRVIFTSVNPAVRFAFDSVRAFMKDYNNGNVNAWMMDKMLKSKATYATYENILGKCDFVDKGEYNERGEKWPIHMEFDWEGATDDPDVYVRPLKYGRIRFAIQWKHVGADGKKWRVGYADNIDDFANKMKHYRDWGNRYKKIKKESLVTEKTKEAQYDHLSSPYYYADKGSKIGNLVKFTTSADGKVQMVLDWGGGYNAESKQNAVLKTWIGSNGMINYQIENTGLDNIDASGTAGNPDDLIAKIAKLKKKVEKPQGYEVK